MNRICVFLGSTVGARASYLEAARGLGVELARRGLGLVYGGANVGLMAELANAALEAGGEVIGILPRKMIEIELSHPGLTELHVVETMHERKAMMADYSDGFIAMPGGLGTLDEFCEIVTWAQIGFHDKPCGFLNVDGYWDVFKMFLDHACGEGFIRPEHLEMVMTADKPAALLEMFKNFKSPQNGKWLNKPTKRRELGG